jgi:hypothetical protein
VKYIKELQTDRKRIQKLEDNEKVRDAKYQKVIIRVLVRRHCSII